MTATTHVSSFRRLSAEEIYDALAKATNVFGHGTDKVDDANGVRLPIWSTGFAMDLPGPLLENLFCDEDIKEFLVFFGRSDREGKLGQERPSIVQASVMLYSNLVRRKTLPITKESLSASC